MSYSKFIDGATSQNGLFTVWRKQTKVYLEITPAQLDHPFLLVPILANGLGRGLFAGLHFKPVLWQFTRVGNQIMTVEKNPYGKAEPGSPVSFAVANSYPQSVISADSIVAIDSTTGNIVFGADVLLTDIVDLTTTLNGPVGESRSAVRYTLNSRLSYFGPTKAFPMNVDIEADLTLSSGSAGFIDTVPDPRSLFVRMHYSIIEMPNTGYRPRIADDRLGYFITARRQYDDEQTPTSFVRYIDRWNLEKINPTARLSKPKNPIVFYLSKDIPVRYRAPISEGLLTWNKAFEKLGIQDAIVVRQQPDDPAWDPDDARYSVVRWVVSPDAAFAYGPHYANPLTGEIFRGDIVIDGNLVRFSRSELERVVEPTKGMTADQRLACSMNDCDYGYEAHEQWEWATLALQSEGVFKDNAPPPTWYVDSYLRSIVLHESGHTLGLRHNFESSTIYSPAQLRDKRFTEQHGIVGSVMEYTPVNLSPHGQPQGAYFQTQLGPWDYFSIRYGYESITARSPEGELPELRRLASQTTQPELRYATDEDNSWVDGFASDPRVNTFDLSNDTLAYAGDVLTIDQRLFNTLQARVPKMGASYAETRRAFASILRSWWLASRYATHYIGGEYFTRNHRGDPHATLPFTPVSRTEERRAFALLDRYVFSDGAFAFSPGLLNSLGDERFYHWQNDPNALDRIDFPLDEYVEGYQLALLGQMWQPNVLARLAELESRVSRPTDTMSLADLFDWTDASMWGDLSNYALRTVPRHHRSLQHFYAEMLIHLMLQPDPGTPSDARTLARHHLVWLNGELSVALRRGGLDEATTANLEDMKTLVDRALQANAVLPL
ncbi:MAG TPA: zinc-dependent metalloprotease [Candidatus Eremiobacteraceae bacterium]|nr:zinc-dependent metalloprotease [Candidatus Eremiobacteraceae bacterium]